MGTRRANIRRCGKKKRTTEQEKQMKLGKVVLAISLFVCAAAIAVAQGGRGNGYGNGNGKAGAVCPKLAGSFALQPLSAEESAKLIFMREEEKLALDVYQALYAKWKIGIFGRIATAEQRHFEAIGTLITRYKLSDPAKPEAGEFTNPEIQRLYADLYAKGTASLLDALQVGVIIEEKDIDDLKAAIAITDNKDILTVYGNLMNGSLNHLSAFNSHLETLSAN
jgi:hypothetical protein